jgi:hypothetical protein
MIKRRGAEGRGQKAKGKGQRAEGRRQRAEGRGQKAIRRIMFICHPERSEGSV